MARRYFCRHVVILPEAASIAFGGGFPRLASNAGRRACQQAIFAIQREMERLAVEESGPAVVLCDRGTVDGLAYWPDSPSTFFRGADSTLERELGRYAAIIHVETAPAGAYHQNSIRLESLKEARKIDARIKRVWATHPVRFAVGHSANFLEKAALALELIRGQIPLCCRTHLHIPGAGPGVRADS
jgi:hypothetical protein